MWGEKVSCICLTRAPDSSLISTFAGATNPRAFNNSRIDIGNVSASHHHTIPVQKLMQFDYDDRVEIDFARPRVFRLLLEKSKIEESVARQPVTDSFSVPK